MNILSGDNIDALIKCCPTSDETKLLQKYSGTSNTLACAERFLTEIMCIPRVDEKLQVLKLYTSFKDEVAVISDQIELLMNACH